MKSVYLTTLTPNSSKTQTSKLQTPRKPGNTGMETKTTSAATKTVKFDDQRAVAPGVF